VPEIGDELAMTQAARSRGRDIEQITHQSAHLSR
jgi:hypothetical protein